MVDWGSRTRVGSIEVDYQTELQHLVLSVFVGCGNDRDDLNDREWVVRNVWNN